MAFIIRIGGTNEFVSKIDLNDRMCCPPGSVDLVEGRSNPTVMLFATLDEAIAAAKQVWTIEGFHTNVEPVGSPTRELADPANFLPRQ